MQSLTRREFCGAVAVSTAVGTKAFAAADEKPFRLRYALASCMYGKFPLSAIVPEVKRAGAECLDLWPAPWGNQREQLDALGREKFRALLEEHQTRLGISTRYDLGPFRLQEELRLVSELGGRMVVTGSAGKKHLAGKELKAAVAGFVEKMKPHLAVAEQLNVTIGIENHAGALIHSPDSLRYLAELSPSPRLGIALAPYHLPQDEKRLAALIAELGPKLVLFYAWQHGKGCMKKMPKAEELEQMPGRGPLDFRPLVAALGQIDYRGPVEIFMHPTPRGIPILETVEQVTSEINLARRYLEECLS